MLRRFLQWLESGERTPAQLLELCLRRIAAADPEVLAWVEVNPRPCPPAGPLRGIPYGAKDIIETRAMATEYGSPLYHGRKGQCDAAIVTHLERAGAVLLGKTQTTAFASFDPAPTRNPRLPGHTPGGSSSGSAAAVAAGMVPFAIGTQTLGSVLRPASYCGVCGFKPAWGWISTEGVLPFAPSFDTLGLFTETAADMLCLWLRLGGRASAAQLRRAACFPGVPAVHVERLRAAGVEVDALDPPPGWPRLEAVARTVNDYEGACTHAALYRESGDRIGARLAELVRRGLAMPLAEYEAALAHIAQMRREFARLFREYPVILSPAATGPAPPGLASTGDPAANGPWTALGVPAIGVPLPVEGPPVGLQITAAHDAGDDLVAMAAQAEHLLSA